MKFIRTNFSYLTALIFLMNVAASSAQTKTADDNKAFQILDKAIGTVFSSENIGIYFEGIAYGIKDPEKIFSLPVYEVFRGGFLFMNKDKFQIELGLMKSISDGKLMVIVDEQSKTMMVDSVRTNDTAEVNVNDLKELVSEDFKDATLAYEGIVDINNHKCHKIKSIVKNNSSSSDVLYWVDISTDQLYLMAENQHESYNVYWFNRLGKAPNNQSYEVHLPEKTLTTFHGYTVVDNRFKEIE